MTENTDTNETYNGWSNKATWLVRVWIDNDEQTAGDVEELTQNVRNSENTSDVWTDEEYVRFTLADKLEQYTETLIPELPASLASDLLTYALAWVAWQELADAYLADYPEDETDPAFLAIVTDSGIVTECERVKVDGVDGYAVHGDALQGFYPADEVTLMEATCPWCKSENTHYFGQVNPSGYAEFRCDECERFFTTDAFSNYEEE